MTVEISYDMLAWFVSLYIFKQIVAFEQFWLHLKLIQTDIARLFFLIQHLLKTWVNFDACQRIHTLPFLVVHFSFRLQLWVDIIWSCRDWLAHSSWAQSFGFIPSKSNASQVIQRGVQWTSTLLAWFFSGNIIKTDFIRGVCVIAVMNAFEELIILTMLAKWLLIDLFSRAGTLSFRVISCLPRFWRVRFAMCLLAGIKFILLIWDR